MNEKQSLLSSIAPSGRQRLLLGMFISVIFPNRQPTLVNRLLTVNLQDYFKLEQN